MYNKSVANGTGTAKRCVLPRPVLAALLAGIATLASGLELMSTPEATADAPDAPVPSTHDIAAAKTNVANLYDGYLKGTVKYSELSRAEKALTAMTGEVLRGPVFGGKRRLEANFAPFRQVTEYWCGPATVQSILWFLGVRDEAAVNNPLTAKGMTGRSDVDQKLLATDEWLGTESNYGTNWGSAVPDAINKWRGTRWYAAFGTPNVLGTLTKDQAWRDIQYAIDHGYPVAANVLLGPGSITPIGFFEGATYHHWETIVGYFEKNGVRYVKVGQVYGAESLGYDPLQEIPWDAYWPAIGDWYGIVW